MSFSLCYGTAYGLGMHEDQIPDSWQRKLKQSIYVFSVLYNPGLMAEKTSILAFYLTLSKTNKTFRWATIVTLAVVNLAGLGLTILNIVQCRPISAAFYEPIPAWGTCTDIVTIYLSSAPVNIITDLAILFLPMPILTGMRLPRKQKLILVVTFSFGIFAAVVDIVRIGYLQSASTIRLSQISDNQAAQRNDRVTDFSYYAALSFMWSCIEVNVGIMCACVPALKPLVSRFMPHLLRDSPNDVTEKSSSVPSFTNNMAQAHRVPSLNTSAQLSAHLSVENPPPEPQRQAPATEEEEEPLGMMDFLTTPETTPADLHRTETMLTNSSRSTRPATPTFFDFVNMQKQKTMVQMSARESVFPIAMVTVLFFIWGFEYGLLDVLNQQFQAVAGMSPGQSVGIHSAYFAGYGVGPLLFGRLVLKHWGFKACYTVGLAIYACGTLVYWPAAVLTSFPTFVIVNFVVGMGLSTLEIAANPFIALCGPPEYAEIRLNLSQAFQAIGTVVAPIIAHKAIVGTNQSAPSLIHTQWAYLGIALFTVLLAAAYYYLPLPEATDDELEDAAERMDGAHHATIHIPGYGPVPVVWITLAIAVVSQLCYVGGQEIIATSWTTYILEVAPGYSPVNTMAIGHAVFAASRLLAAGLGFWIRPRWLLLLFFLGATLFSICGMHWRGATDVAMVIVVFFFEGPLFSLIFAQAIRGMGRSTKTASVLLVSSISGGAIFPPLAFAAQKSGGIQYSLAVAVATFAGGLVLPFWLLANKKARRVCDPIKERDVVHEGVEGRQRGLSQSRASDGVGVGAGVGEGAGGKEVGIDGDGNGHGSTSSMASRASKALSFFSLKKKHSKEMQTEWREKRGDSVADM